MCLPSLTPTVLNRVSREDLPCGVAVSPMDRKHRWNARLSTPPNLFGATPTTDQSSSSLDLHISVAHTALPMA